MVAAVDDGGAVRAGEHIGGGQGAESPQDRGLSAQGHLLTVTQQACRKGAAGWEQDSTELRGWQERRHVSECILLPAKKWM